MKIMIRKEKMITKQDRPEWILLFPIPQWLTVSLMDAEFMKHNGRWSFHTSISV